MVFIGTFFKDVIAIFACGGCGQDTILHLSLLSRLLLFLLPPSLPLPPATVGSAANAWEVGLIEFPRLLAPKGRWEGVRRRWEGRG